MIPEVLIAAGVYASTVYMKHANSGSDKQKLDRIFRKCGLSRKYDSKEETAKLIRHSKKEGYSEYAYRIPEGFSHHDFLKKQDAIEDSLNAHTGVVTLSDLRQVNVSGDIKRQIQKVMKSKRTRKELVMSYDKVLTLKIFDKPMPEFVKYENNCNGWKVPIGVTRTEYIKHDFEKIMHMVVAGTTRYGKSIFLKNAITTLISNQPHNVIFTLIDLKGGLTFSRFRNCSQVQCIASDVTESMGALEQINRDMDEVMEHFKQKGFENVAEAKLPTRHFIIVDEGAELSPKIERDPDLRDIKNKCETYLSRIARIGGALGYRLIYATQTPYSEVLNHNIKQNCDAKLCFRLQTDKASEVVLGESIVDAGRLPHIKGRAVYLTDRKYIVQTPLIENDYIEGVISNDIQQ
ncbi:FtsK/SpoIIIE domain-containing protein [Alkalihalophilus marmarensis]|uniref:FtsK/SpoIIIE domain-containing protein n=1 Tax=Alkalihalophilus marmarensis TaxID=521377 RepID=UPI002E217269|nr:FtsK/SpoIIIE domain-containing protein [Alkalihalophilus marmarensis]MED1603600.1 FtsK/SpoIIIE domain-containing protein [Alkalihalophilus marmarensis]